MNLENDRAKKRRLYNRI